MTEAFNLIHTISQLTKQVNHLDELLTTSLEKDQVKTNINEDGWEEIAKNAAEAFYTLHRPALTNIKDKLIYAFESANTEQKQQLIALVSNTKSLKRYISIHLQDIEEATTEEREKLIRGAIILQLLGNLEPDPRDEMMYINELMLMAKEYKIDYKKIVNSLLPFANDTDKYGFGSMKTILSNLSDKQFRSPNQTKGQRRKK